ncbi:solute symporter family protein [Burkholderia glumae]|uniref:solute symporter family protein n=3 Tax=Burkholderia glumae TaxID=337 RepID=UPI00021786A2|nr:cation acetate symporter [Burkholderia glumae]ACR32820.2 SSS sodium solute transporter superfamily protein [Burkholderia glumae BGR1]QGA41633.1 sodium/solute symporter [Burkholderia glumae]UVS88481.1 cation acetate symporter [Burkholderia glumae]UVT05814.1 cation acetate symporter [Burkholderia glumae]
MGIDRLRRCAATVLALAASSAYANGASGIVQHQQLTMLAFAMVILATIAITIFASRRASTAGDFYTAGGSIGPLRNGLAIAGDYLSAAAFLGASGLIALYGFDGMIYLVGFFAAFIPVLLFIAEPCRNLGRFTIGDVLVVRNSYKATKVASALSSVVVALAYMIPQIVGGAVIVRALVGIDYTISVLAVGVLMLVYVACGGMRATTWVQVIKAVLLIGASLILVVLAWIPFGFHVPTFMKAVVNSPMVQARVAEMAAGASLSGDALGWRFLEPGLFLTKPLELFSLGLALVLGTAAMPHVLMRFFTVRDATAARHSVLWAMFGIGLCHLCIIVIGFAAAYYVGAGKIMLTDKGGNLAAPLLAQTLSGGASSVAGDLMLAFVAAVAFATIVAVIAGLTLAAASSLAHDVYVGAWRSGRATEREQVAAARIATVLVGVVAISVSVALQGQNVAQLVGLGYAVAASANLPALMLTLYWRRCTTQGVLAGIIGGTLAAVALVMVSPNMEYPALERASAIHRVQDLTGKLSNAADDKSRTVLRRELIDAETVVQMMPAKETSIVGLRAPLIGLRNPGIVSIPIGFLLVVLISLFTRDRVSESRWAELVVRRETAIGAAVATNH